MGEEKIRTLRDIHGKEIKAGDKIQITDPLLESVYKLGIPKTTGIASYVDNKCYINNTEVFLTDLLEII